MSKPIAFTALDGSVQCFLEDEAKLSKGPFCCSYGGSLITVASLFLLGGRWVRGIAEVRGFTGPLQYQQPFKEVSPQEAMLWCCKQDIEPPAELVATLRTTKSENAKPPTTTTPKSEHAGEDAMLPTKTTTEEDRPTPEMFRAYIAWQRGIRQTAIGEQLDISQPTVCRYLKRVEAWIAAGNDLPGLDELPKPERRPKTFSVDPAKMSRWTAESGPEGDE
jgi:hypothetical protein